MSFLVAAGRMIAGPVRTGRAADRTAVLRTVVADHSSADLVDLVEMGHLVAMRTSAEAAQTITDSLPGLLELRTALDSSIDRSVAGFAGRHMLADLAALDQDTSFAGRSDTMALHQLLAQRRLLHLRWHLLLRAVA